MILGIAVLIFLAGCIVSSVDDASASARREARRQEELMKLLSENRNVPSVPRQTRVTRRRIAQDKDGNVLAEEITEETL